MKRLKEIVISRRRWGRGPTGGRLRDDETGLQCCLGFVCRAFGVPLYGLKGASMPCALEDRHRSKLPDWLFSGDAEDAATINDKSRLTDEKREAHIKAIFKRNGLRAVFKP